MDLFKKASKRRTYCGCIDCNIDQEDKSIRKKTARNKLKTELRKELRNSPSVKEENEYNKETWDI